ncbi:MAG: hypothetical protein JW892_13245 [Anaerolineae bacterium]|nr:hypothetical protein [Anaerolineae bacterium]
MFKVFVIASSDVTLQNLEITLDITPAYPLLISDELNSSLISVPSGAGMTGISIKDNIIHVPGQLLPMSQWTARAITVGSNTVSGMSITGNTIYNTRNGVVIHYNNLVTISGNTIYNTKGGIMNYTGSQADADNRIMSNNSWTASHSEWDIVWNSGGGPYQPDYSQSVLGLSNQNNGAYVLSLMTTGDINTLTGNRSHIFVDDDSSFDTMHRSRGNFNEPFKTIALGIEAVVPGGTVYVADGTYVEQVVIDGKNLTLVGESLATIIQAPDSVPTCFTTSAANKPIVCVMDATATIDTFTIDGAGKGNVNNRFQGVAFRNAGGTLQNSAIIDVCDTPFSGVQHGVAIYAYNDDTASRTINVWDNTVTGFQKNAMALNANSTTPLVVDVQRNTVAGEGATTVTAQNGIQVWADLGSGVVADNVVSGIAYDNTAASTKYAATSILNYYTDLDINGNTITGAHMGIYNIDGAGDITENTLNIEKIGVYAYGINATDPPEAVPSPYEPVAEGTGVSPLGAGINADLDVNVSNNTLVFTGTDNTSTYGIEADAGYGVDNIAIEVNNNSVSGFEYGIVFYQCESDCDTGVFTAASATDNGLDNNTVALYSNIPSFTVDASGNWLGNSDPATVATLIAGDIDYTPWLASGADTPADPGFQGDFSELWVDDDSPQTGTTGRIQEGIDLVSGSTVNVAAGTYVEDPVIDKPVTLLGPNAAINPNTGTRVAEAVIYPAISAPDPGVCEVMVYIEVSDVTIKGFTFDGDNPALTSGIIIDGADVDACEILAGYEGMGNIVVENNILKHSTYSGIDFYNYVNSAATAGNYVRYNRFEDIGETTYNWGIGVLIYNNFYADITDNVFEGVRTGIQTGNYYRANPGTTGSISNNQIGVWRLGIFHNLAYSDASPFTISGNTITAETYLGANKWNGLLLSSIGGAVNATITGNDVDIPEAVSYTAPGYTAGYNVWNVTTTAPIAISGGTVTGGDYGVFVNNFEGYSGNANNTAVTINGVTIVGSDVAGVYVKDSPSNTNGATVYANIQSSVIDTDATGILVEGADATAKANNNKIAGNPTAGVTNTSGVMMDAEHNWWGNPCGPAATGADSVSADVDYTPWWFDEAMTTEPPESGGEWTVPTGATTPEAQTILNCAAGRTVVFEGGVYPGGLFVNGNQTTINLNGSTVGKGSPAFTINADDVTINGPGVLDGDNDTFPGILVNAGADNFILDGVEVREWANGVQLAGDVTSFKIVSNWIHSNTGNGLLIDAGVALGGIVTIEGNLFKVNGGNGIQHNGIGTLLATYNSWGDVGGPTAANGDSVGGSVTYDPWTFAEIYLDVDPVTSGDQVTQNVIEGDTFDVALKVEAANLHAVQFRFAYDNSLLTYNGLTWDADWDPAGAPPAGYCIELDGLAANEIGYACAILGDETEAWDGSTVATFSFTANGTGLATGNGPWSAFFDISHEVADTSAGAYGGVKVFVNNAGFNTPSDATRNITDADDGEIIITGLANFTGFINLQGRVNDSGAVIQVYGAAPKAGAVLLAQGASVSSGEYTTVYETGQQLTVGTTYYFQVDRALYIPTTAMATTGPLPAVLDDWQDYANLSVRPLTTLNTVILLGGDATDDDMIELSDAVCIGTQYGSATPVACGSGTGFGAGTSADVNGDGTVDLLDLVLMGGNYEKNSSLWTPQ